MNSLPGSSPVCPFKLALFFSRGVSLRQWHNSGLFSREVALYLHLQQLGAEIAFVTWGGKDDLEFADELPGISILPNRWRLPERVYAHAIPFLHRRELTGCDLFKTNQIYGADVALRAGWFWRKPVVARCGYLLSTILQHEGTPAEHQQACELENRLFRQAACGMVSTPLIARQIRDRNPHLSTPLFVQPNFIDTQLFRPTLPRSTVGKTIDLMFVGRISPEKNLAGLLEAIRPLDCTLAILGEGPQKEKLQTRFADLSSRIIWAGTVANSDLPAWLNQARAFVLPSRYEGHPKALLEAMACGLPVVGTSVCGIQELIADGITGRLCETDSHSLRATIADLLASPQQQQQLGFAARRFVETSFPLHKLAAREFSILEQIARAPFQTTLSVDEDPEDTLLEFPDRSSQTESPTVSPPVSRTAHAS